MRRRHDVLRPVEALDADRWIAKPKGLRARRAEVIVGIDALYECHGVAGADVDLDAEQIHLLFEVGADASVVLPAEWIGVVRDAQPDAARILG